MRSTSWASREASDSLTSYQCAGEHAGGLYAFDQNNLDWTGNVLLFTQSQLTSLQDGPSEPERADSGHRG